jgi:hypothetical protein
VSVDRKQSRARKRAKKISETERAELEARVRNLSRATERYNAVRQLMADEQTRLAAFTLQLRERYGLGTADQIDTTSGALTRAGGTA